MLAGWNAIGLGVGASLLAYAANNELDPNLLTMQLTYICVFPLMFGAYRWGFGKLPRVTFPEKNAAFEKKVLEPLVVAGWVLIVWRAVQMTVFAATGADDRGDFSLVAQDQYFGVWTYFSLFPRFNSLGYFLVPLVFARSTSLAKLVLLGILAYCQLLGFSSGARGLVIYPIIYIGVGMHFFRSIQRLKIDIAALVVVLCTMPLLIFMDHFRNTEGYRASRTIDVSARLQTLGEAAERSKATKEDSASDGANLVILGSALIGFSDTIIYAMTPDLVPHAGAENFSGVIYTWVPFFLYKDRPVLYDSNIIMFDYLEGPRTRTGRAISLEADLYRRFSWIGIPFGVFFFYYIYGRFCRFCYHIYFFKDSFLGILMILFLFSFLQARPFSTVLTTWWTFFYEVPKHLIAGYVFYILVKTVRPTGRIPGVLKF